MHFNIGKVLPFSMMLLLLLLSTLKNDGPFFLNVPSSSSAELNAPKTACLKMVSR